MNCPFSPSPRIRGESRHQQQQEDLIKVDELVWLPFPVPWSAGILAVLTPLFDPSRTCPAPVCCLLCLSRLLGVDCLGFYGTKSCFAPLHFPSGLFLLLLLLLLLLMMMMMMMMMMIKNRSITGFNIQPTKIREHKGDDYDDENSDDNRDDTNT